MTCRFIRIMCTLLGIMFAASAGAQTPPGGLPIPTTSDYGDPYDAFGAVLAADGNWAVASGLNGEAFYVYERTASGNWTRRQRIVPPTLGQAFFRTPHILGNRLIISRPVDNSATPAAAGTIYVYERPSEAAPFGLSATLRPADPQHGDRFGYGLAQSADRIFVGASGRDEGALSDQGVVYVFRLNATVWEQEARLTPLDAGASARFGQDLTFDGQDLLIGAQGHRVSPTNQGAAYVYRLIGGVWTEVQKIVEPGTSGSPTLRFGYNVSASNGRAFLAGLGWNSEYFYARAPDGIWGAPQRLSNPLAGLTQLFSYVPDFDLRGDRLIAHVDSAISFSPYVQGPLFLVSYKLTGETWTQISRVQLPDEAAGSADAVVVANGAVLSAQPNFDASASAPDQGAILPYAFAADATIGAPTPRIWHGSGNIPDRLGSAVAADGDWMLASAPGSDTGGTDGGALHFFKRSAGGEWRRLQSIVGATASKAVCALAVHGDLAAVGRCSESVGAAANRGVVQIYKRQIDDQWAELCTLTPVDPAATRFGGSVQMSSAGLWVGLTHATGLRGVEAFSLAGDQCGTGQALAAPPANHTYYPSSMSGNRGALVLFCLIPSPCTSRVEIYDKVGDNWALSQTINPGPPIGGRLESAQDVAIDGDDLAIAFYVPVGALDGTFEVRLYDRTAGTYLLGRTIQAQNNSPIGIPLETRGDVLLVSDPNIGPNGGVAVYQFGSGLRLQEIAVAGLGIEDGTFQGIAMGSASRAVVGWPELDRLGYNNAGLLYTLESVSARGSNPWTITVVADVPLPERIFNDFFDDLP